MLADRGFDIGEDVARMLASLKIPAFTRGREQLSPKDIEETHQLANVRIHIERVVGATHQRYSYFDELYTNRFCKVKKTWRTTNHRQNNNCIFSIEQLVSIFSTY